MEEIFLKFKYVKFKYSAPYKYKKINLPSHYLTNNKV
jgi:hypothetical protein